VSIAPESLSSGKLSGLTTSLFHTDWSCAFVGLIMGALASQTGRANPSAACAATARFVFNAGLIAKCVTTSRADDLCDSFQNFQILGGRDPSR